MSFDVGPIASTGASQIQRDAKTGAAASQAAPATAGTEAAVSVDVAALPKSPPPEMRNAIATAAESYARLGASGRQLSFGLDPNHGALTIELQDLAGNRLSTLSPADVLRIADGAKTD